MVTPAYLALCLAASVSALPGADILPAEAKQRLPSVLRTDKGVRFAMLGKPPACPAPTVFILALDCETTLADERYVRVGRLLSSHGFLCISVDLPCHGDDARQSEPQQLSGWRARTDRGEDFVREFTARASGVLDYLIRERWTDPGRVAACGTSRGGFLAMHFAAADVRVRCAAAFSPVTELTALKEFEGAAKDGLAAALSLRSAARTLAHKAVWLCIGNSDRRAGTGAALSFARALAEASSEQGGRALFEAHVMEADGHNTPEGAHEMAADWILRHLPGAPHTVEDR